MKLHVLGCGDAFGSGGRHQSGYLVEASDRLFLLDCGPTTLLAMKRAGLNPSDVDAIILSHLHGDHFGGIPFFFIEYLSAASGQSANDCRAAGNGRTRSWTLRIDVRQRPECERNSAHSFPHSKARTAAICEWN